MNTINEIHKLHELSSVPTYERVRNFYYKAESERKGSCSDYITEHEKNLDKLISNPKVNEDIREAIKGVRTRLKEELGINNA